MRRWTAVDAVWREIREQSPSHEVMAEARIVVAGAYADRGELKQAIALMEPAQKTPKKVRDYHLRQWYVLADLLDRAGDTMGATRWFREVLCTTTPTSPTPANVSAPSVDRARTGRRITLATIGGDGETALPRRRGGGGAAIRRAGDGVRARRRPGRMATPAGRDRVGRDARAGRVARAVGGDRPRPSATCGSSSSRRTGRSTSGPTDMRSTDRIGQAHRWFFFEPLDDDVVPQPDGSEFAAGGGCAPPDLIDCVVEFRRGPYAQVLGSTLWLICSRPPPRSGCDRRRRSRRGCGRARSTTSSARTIWSARASRCGGWSSRTG